MMVSTTPQGGEGEGPPPQGGVGETLPGREGGPGNPRSYIGHVSFAGILVIGCLSRPLMHIRYAIARVVVNKEYGFLVC